RRTTIVGMLRRLRIENLVLIREAELELAPGLNAITGETGAGKTILAQAIGLLLGTKGDDLLVGPAGEEAYVEAELDLPDELDELAELRPESEDALLVSRRVLADGRTRAYAWGRAAASPPRSSASSPCQASSSSGGSRGPRTSSTCSTVSAARSSCAAAPSCAKRGATSWSRAAGTRS